MTVAAAAAATSIHGGMRKSDYIAVLKHYERPIPATAAAVRSEAEQLLNTKLCKCIKSVVAPEPVAIATCTKTIYNRRGLRRGAFSCRRGRRRRRRSSSSGTRRRRR